MSTAKKTNAWRSLIKASKDALSHLEIAIDNAESAGDRRMLQSCVKSLEKSVARSEKELEDASPTR